MKCVQGIWIPDRENYLSHFLEVGPRFAGAGTYQLRKLLAALVYVDNFDHSVDVGAHVGCWSRVFAQCFDKVTAFEPMQDSAACFRRNVSKAKIVLHQVALGDTEGVAKMDSRLESTAFTRIAKNGDCAVTVKRLDDFQLGPINLLKIDVEGFEKFVLMGGEETIRKSKPVIVVEQKPNNSERYGLDQNSARDLLKSWGAHEKWEKQGDICMVWKK